MKNLLILGGGTAGTLMLNKLIERSEFKDWHFTIVDKDENHYYQPGFLFIPFGIYTKEEVFWPKKDFFPKKTEVIFDEVMEMMPAENKVLLKSGKELAYDLMIILHTATVGNPAFMDKLPTMIGGLPGFEALASAMMRKEMDRLDIPPVSEFFEMIVAGGGRIFACKLAVDMFHLKREDFIDDLEGIITVGDMYNLAHGEGAQIKHPLINFDV